MSLLICPPPVQTRPIPDVQMLEPKGFFHINSIGEYFRTSNQQGPVQYFKSVNILQQKQAAILQFSVSRILWHPVVLWQTGRISCHLNSFQSLKNKLMKHPTPCLLHFIRLRATHISEVQPEVWGLSFHISNVPYTEGSCRHPVLQWALWSSNRKLLCTGTTSISIWLEQKHSHLHPPSYLSPNTVGMFIFIRENTHGGMKKGAVTCCMLHMNWI